MQGISQTLAAGVSQGSSAWQMAGALEKYLGAGRGCPRWTSARLRLSKAAIAGGDLTGLLSGADCAAKGVAYNALRLARNELQVIHGISTDAAMAKMPWLFKEQISLSFGHAEEDECDQVVRGGENGAGIYPKGTITLPIHVHCAPAGQLVKTISGDRPIETVKPGDQVLTHKRRFRPVRRIGQRRFTGELIRITTASGRVLMVTPDHPIMTSRGWIEAGRIQAGDLADALDYQPERLSEKAILVRPESPIRDGSSIDAYVDHRGALGRNRANAHR